MRLPTRNIHMYTCIFNIQSIYFYGKITLVIKIKMLKRFLSCIYIFFFNIIYRPMNNNLEIQMKWCYTMPKYLFFNCFILNKNIYLAILQNCFRSDYVAKLKKMILFIFFSWCYLLFSGEWICRIFQIRTRRKYILKFVYDINFKEFNVKFICYFLHLKSRCRLLVSIIHVYIVLGALERRSLCKCVNVHHLRPTCSPSGALLYRVTEKISLSSAVWILHTIKKIQ